MHQSALAHCLTSDEQEQFDRNGFLMIPDAFSPEMVQKLTERVDLYYAEALKKGDAVPHNLYEKADFIGLDPLFLDLIDCAKILPKVWGILGWNISIFHTHMNVTPPYNADRNERKTLWPWHQDNAQLNVDLKQAVLPRLSLKVAIYLTDLTQPNAGNTYAIPGSYNPDQKPQASAQNGGLPEGAIALTGKPYGTAMILDQRVWHTSSPNFSDIARKVLFIGYGYRWLQPLDKMQVAHMADHCDPIRDQLLDLSKTYLRDAYSNRYYPTKRDVPLLQWLNEHLGEDKVAQPRHPAA